VSTQKGQQPAAPQYFDVSDGFNQATRGDRRCPGDHHLIEDACRVGEGNKHAPCNVTLKVETEGFDQAKGDGRHENHARNSGWRHKRQEEIGHDQTQQKARIGAADPQHYQVSNTARQTRFTGHDAK